jgi:UDP-N-acetylmuramyl pentapeptide synthase
MRKRSSYRPRPTLANPLLYVLESFRPVRDHDTYLLELKIKNHGAMSNLTKGVAARQDVDILISMVNVVEALHRMGFGKEYRDVVKEGLDSLFEIGRRGIKDGRFIVKAQEMSHLNTAMELHDAQMDVITIKDMEKAIELVNREFNQRKMRRIA